MKTPNISTCNININLYSYLKCRLSINNFTSIFLINTSADIVFKHNKVLKEPFDSSKITSLIQTFGLVDLDLRVGNVSIPAEWHIVNDDFPILVDGILGMVFIRRQKCILDYQGMEDRIISKSPSLPNDVRLTLLTAKNINSISTPARSEVIRQVNFQSEVEDVLVLQ